MPPIELWSYLRDGGPLFLLSLILYGLYRRWWVPGWLYREIKTERDGWKQLALKGTGQADTAIEKARTILGRTRHAGSDASDAG